MWPISGRTPPPHGDNPPPYPSWFIYAPLSYKKEDLYFGVVWSHVYETCQTCQRTNICVWLVYLLQIKQKKWFISLTSTELQRQPRVNSENYRLLIIICVCFCVLCWWVNLLGRRGRGVIFINRCHLLADEYEGACSKTGCLHLDFLIMKIPQTVVPTITS